MKKLIITALNSAIIKLDSIIPKTKKETKSVDISDVNYPSLKDLGLQSTAS